MKRNERKKADGQKLAKLVLTSFRACSVTGSFSPLEEDFSFGELLVFPTCWDSKSGF